MPHPTDTLKKPPAASPNKNASRAQEDSPFTPAQAFIERAGGAYFEACHRLARAINRLKGARKKR